MKKTVIYETVDGQDIITGFDAPTVDPVETRKKVDAAIKDTPEYQAAEAKKAEGNEAAKAMQAASKARDDEAYKMAVATMAVRQEEMKPLAIALADKITALRRSEAVYFTPRTGEVIRTPEEVATLKAAIEGRAAGTFITLDGDTVHDNRGQVFYRKVNGKWGRTHIVKIGDPVPTDAVLHEDLTDTQRGEVERDRVSTLTDTVKAEEKATAMDKAIKAASEMRSRLEIKEDPDALAKSQKAYKADVAKINTLYK